MEFGIGASQLCAFHKLFGFGVFAGWFQAANVSKDLGYESWRQMKSRLLQMFARVLVAACACRRRQCVVGVWMDPD